MGAFTKAFGILSVFAGIAIALFTLYVAGATDWTTYSAAGTAGELAAGGEVLIIGALGLVALLFLTVGGVAYCVGEWAENGLPSRR